MRIIGITGGVGAGKSEILEYLSENYDAKVVQLDEVGYLLMRPGASCYAPVVKLFGSQITDDEGEINRRQLAEIVFNDPEKLDALNKIVHPAVKKYIRASINQEKTIGTDYYFIEGALLIEDHYEEICEEIWYIHAGERTRRERLKTSRGYSDEKIDRLFAIQLSIEEFEAHSDYIIMNNRGFDFAQEQIVQRMKLYETM